MTVASIDHERATIRHNACQLLLPAQSRAVRCKQCSIFRSHLRVRNCRLQKPSKKTDIQGTAPYCSLSKAEMQSRMRSLHKELRRILKQRDRLIHRVQAEVASNGVIVNDEIHSDLKAIINTNVQNAPQNSFQHAFWQQQADVASRNDSRGMRWHPLMIRFGLIYIHVI